METEPFFWGEVIFKGEKTEATWIDGISVIQPKLISDSPVCPGGQKERERCPSSYRKRERKMSSRLGKGGRCIGCRNSISSAPGGVSFPEKGGRFSRKWLCVHFRKVDPGIKQGLPPSAKLPVSHKTGTREPPEFKDCIGFDMGGGLMAQRLVMFYTPYKQLDFCTT